jgi:superfamily II DNA/RNA helicase
MYNKNRYKPRYQGARKQRGYRIKSFDPSHIVKNVQVMEPANEVYDPVHKFADFAISNSLKANIASRGYDTPTPIQDQAIPEILKGSDVVGMANTGTGKTGAFLIPLIDKVLKGQERVLVIAPTRELAVQIDDELKLFAKNLGIHSAICIGGVSLHAQSHKLASKPQFVVGTPGRLIDLNNQRKIDFRNFNSIVLDEVDRMLDMGFVRDVERIIRELPHARQSLFFSATMGGNVLSVMSKFTKEPVAISVKSEENTSNVEQEIIKTDGKSKMNQLQEMLDSQEFEKVLVFGRTKRGAERLARDLSRSGFSVSAIHGNKTQNQRQNALNLFKDGKVNVLVATDVVARGIDVDDITHVINYDLPESYEDYMHRIGRTGRAGKKGKAITFVG